jgi:hypothetical protein
MDEIISRRVALTSGLDDKIGGLDALASVSGIGGGLDALTSASGSGSVDVKGKWQGFGGLGTSTSASDSSGVKGEGKWEETMSTSIRPVSVTSCSV